MSRYHTLYNSSAKFATSAVTTASASSSALTSRRITISVSADTFVEFAGTPTATTSSFLIPAGQVLDFNFTSGEKVAYRTASGTGYISIIDAD